METAIRARLGELHPEGAQALDALGAAAWAATDAAVLDLCRRRLVALLGGGGGSDGAALDDWDTAPRFSAGEKARLAFTELFATSVSAIGQPDVDALLEHAGPREVYDFIGALYVVDMTHRLETVAAAVLGDGDA